MDGRLNSAASAAITPILGLASEYDGLFEVVFLVLVDFPAVLFVLETLLPAEFAGLSEDLALPREVFFCVAISREDYSTNGLILFPGGRICACKHEVKLLNNRGSLFS